MSERQHANENETTAANEQEPSTETTYETEKNDTASDQQKTDGATHGKILVVYYSATGSTKEAAMQIAENLQADTFEIIPENIYTADDLDWTNDHSRVSQEHNDEALREVALTISKPEQWHDYDTVLIGYPIWWGIAAWPVNDFIKNNDFSGKTVIPFCTSASSGIGSSGKLLEEMAGSGNWLAGERFGSGASAENIKAWTDSLQEIIAQ
ncbi:MAG: flavodoxin [Clostridiales bacterium]|nr:flavodoxin [Clostridiales bacterium]